MQRVAVSDEDLADGFHAALDELRAGAHDCPRRTVPTPNGVGVERLRYDVNQGHRERELPVADNLVTYQEISMRGSTRRIFVAYVFQRRGALLDGVHEAWEHRPADRELDDLLWLAGVAGDKLSRSRGNV